LTLRVLITAITYKTVKSQLHSKQRKERYTFEHPHTYGYKIPTYLVTNCKYNSGFTVPGVFERSLDERSKNTVKQVLLSSPHNFHAVVPPSPMAVSATAGPFCKFCNNQHQTPTLQVWFSLLSIDLKQTPNTMPSS
jgi:hypothetical protein